MNKNTRTRFIAARKMKHAGDTSPSFDVPKIMGGVGERATWGTYGKKTFNFAVQTRKSTKPKVAAEGCKNPNGPTLMEQGEIYYGVRKQ